MSEKECADVLRKLIQKQLLTIKEHKNSQNQLSEAYCLNPLWEKLFIVEEPKQEPVQSDGTIFVLFEQEFGRPLSPFEIEMVDRKSTRLNSSHVAISYAVFCLKKK